MILREKVDTKVCSKFLEETTRFSKSLKAEEKDILKECLEALIICELNSLSP